MNNSKKKDYYINLCLCSKMRYTLEEFTINIMEKSNLN